MGGLVGIYPASSSEPIAVTDMTGRTIQLPGVPRRIVLLEARDIVSMAMLHQDPASLIVGWAAADRIDSQILQDRLRRGHAIEIVGKQTPDTVSLEGLVSLSPDLVVANAYMAPQGGKDLLVERLESMGIPVVFSDMSSNAAIGRSQSQSALSGMRDHMRMWGEILDAKEQAAAFIAFVNERLERVAARLADARPVVTYLEVQSTVDDCCWAAGNKVWGELLELAGGKTLPGVTDPWFQKLQLEYFLSTPHEVYIASGGDWSAGGRPAIGPGIPPAEGREGLKRIIKRTGFNELPSVRNQRVHGIWTGLITVPPLNILFVELAAKWLHPKRCADIDPSTTLSEINQRYLSTPIPEPLWASLRE